jgi:hypothetical protein
MRLYKWLMEGAIDPERGIAWPTPRNGDPGGWVKMRRFRGVQSYALDKSALSYGIDAELWEVEVAEPVVTLTELMLKKGKVGNMMGLTHGPFSDHNPRVRIVSRRGRLLQRVRSWTPDVASECALTFSLRGRGFAVQAVKLLTDSEEPTIRKLLAGSELPELVARLVGASTREEIRQASGEVAERIERLQAGVQHETEASSDEQTITTGYLVSEALQSAASALQATSQAAAAHGSPFADAATAAESAVLGLTNVAAVFAMNEGLRRGVPMTEAVGALAATLSPQTAETERHWQAQWLRSRLRLK